MAEPVQITLSPHWHLYLKGLIMNRRFESADDAIESALRVFEAQESDSERLRRALEEGERDGGFEEWDYDGFKAEMKRDSDERKAA